MTLSICICTASRPEVLRRCLQAIADGSVQPAEILVSDDSADGAATRMVCDSSTYVIFMARAKDFVQTETRW